MSRARLVDVAQLAGVSPKTVSNVVNGYVHVSPQMRAHVQAAISELNYVPNTTARQLRSGRTGIIALAVPDLSVPYFAELARYVTSAAEAQGFTILVDQTDGLESRERLIAGGLRKHVIDGLIFSPLAMDAAEIAEIAEIADGTPMVLLGERDHPASTDHVVIDNEGAAALATRHLIGLGRRRIAVIGAPVDCRTGTGASRVAGYRAALAAAGLPYNSELVITTTHFRRDEGSRALKRLLDLEEPPDAVFCCNDLLALGALHAARQRSVSVPQQLAVIGFDDIEETRYSYPPLSTISPDKARIARTAVELLVRRLSGQRSGVHDEVLVDYDLVVRESTVGASLITDA